MNTDQLPPLPDMALSVVKNRRTQQTQLSDHGAAYYGSNWYVER